MGFRYTVMPHISRLGAVVATMIIMGCGGPAPNSPVVGQVSGSAEALLSTSTSAMPRTSPGVNAPVHRDPIQRDPVRTPTPQSAFHVALSTTTTDGSCSAPDSHIPMAASPADAPPSNERINAACVQRELQHGRYVQGQEHPEGTAQLQAQELWIEQPSDEMAPMTYTLADLENEPDHAHELWMEQVIQEVMNFDES